MPAAIASPVSSLLGGSLNPAALGPLSLLGLNSGTGGLLSGLGPIGDVFGTARRLAIDVVNAPTSLLFGKNLIPSGPQPTGGTATISGSTATTPLTVRGGTEPIVDASIGSGGAQPLLVDTGSTGLIVPPQDVNMQALGAVTGHGSVTYGEPGNTLTETYNTYTTTVNFGNGITTAPTSVAVVTSVISNGTSYSTSEAPAILGIGVNAGGPTTSPVPALPGGLGQGVLLDEPGGVMEFGANPLPAYASVSGAPVTTLDVKINNGTLTPTNDAFIDSGGLDGAVPTALHPPDVNGYVPSGTTLSVYTSGGTFLYTTTVGSQQTPVVSSQLGGDFNTGIIPFLEDPIYLSYTPSGSGTMIFDT